MRAKNILSRCGVALLLLASSSCSGDETEPANVQSITEGNLEPGQYELPFSGIPGFTGILSVPAGFKGDEPGGWYILSRDSSAFPRTVDDQRSEH